MLFKTTHWLLLLTLLAGCTKKDEPTPPTATDPLLGHWEAESLRDIKYEASGRVTSDQSSTINSKLDVTATTITFTSVVNGRTSTEVDAYTRSGEQLVLVPPGGSTNGETYYARSLTSASFTFEFNGKRTSGQPYYVQTIPYHR